MPVDLSRVEFGTDVMVMTPTAGIEVGEVLTVITRPLHGWITMIDVLGFRIHFNIQACSTQFEYVVQERVDEADRSDAAVISLRQEEEVPGRLREGR